MGPPPVATTSDNRSRNCPIARSITSSPICSQQVSRTSFRCSTSLMTTTINSCWSVPQIKSSTGFRSGLFGGQFSGSTYSGTWRCKNATVCRERYKCKRPDFMQIFVDSVDSLNSPVYFVPPCTLCSGICYRKSVCHLSVTFVHPTQPVEIFRNVSTPFCTLAIGWPPCIILHRSTKGNLSVGG